MRDLLSLFRLHVQGGQPEAVLVAGLKRLIAAQLTVCPGAAAAAATVAAAAAAVPASATAAAAPAAAAAAGGEA